MDGNYTKSAIVTDTMRDVRWVTDDVKRIYKLKHEMKTNEKEENDNDDDDDDGEERKKRQTEMKKESGQAGKQTNEQQSLPSASHKNLGLVK